MLRPAACLVMIVPAPQGGLAKRLEYARSTVMSTADLLMQVRALGGVGMGARRRDCGVQPDVPARTQSAAACCRVHHSWTCVRPCRECSWPRGRLWFGQAIVKVAVDTRPVPRRPCHSLTHAPALTLHAAEGQAAGAGAGGGSDHGGDGLALVARHVYGKQSLQGAQQEGGAAGAGP